MPEGLIQQASTEQVPEEGMIDQAQAMPEEQGADELTPEEREAYDAAMKMTAEIIYKSDESSNMIAERLKASEPPEDVAETTSFIISQLEQAFNGQLPEEIILPLADEISDLLIEFAEDAGAFEFVEDDYPKIKGAVVQLLLDDYGVDEADMEGMLQDVTPEDMQGIQSIFGG
jgi:hypothetical protein